MAGLPQGWIRDGGQSSTVDHSAAKKYLLEGTSLLRARRFPEAEKSLRESLRLRPDDPEVLNNLGTTVWEQGRAAEATAYYLRALQFRPRDFGILNNLGIALWDQDRPERAVVFYRRALDIQPDSLDTQINLAVALSDLGEFDDALTLLRKVLVLNPNSPEAWDNAGMTFARQGHSDQAIACYDRAIALRPDFGEAHRNRALAWLSQGDFERGWPEAEWRLKCRNPPGFVFPFPRWTGEDLNGQPILLHWEQGLGDTLQFIRFAPLVKERGALVWVYCQPPLHRLVARNAGVDHILDGKAPAPDFPVHAPLLSVPAILGNTVATLPAAPYLSADAATISHWRAALLRALGVADLASVFKIGIAWQGSRQNRIDRWRSFPLEQFAPLAGLPGVRLISLQKGTGTEQLGALAGRFGVTELPSAGPGGEDERDLLDTAAVMSLLDLVVAPDTAVGHLAGSLGVRAWIALSHVGEWRWMVDGDNTPWYPSIRIFRQTKLNDWESVFRRMADALRQGAFCPRHG